MGISGRKEKMAAGRLDNAIVQPSNTEWVETTTKNGKDVVQLLTEFIDQDGRPHKTGLILGDQQYVRVEDGKLQSVDDTREYQMSANSPAGKFLNSLEDAGFSGKKLDKIGDDPSVIDGQWMRVVQKASTSLKTDGTPFTDLIVEELVDESEATGSKKKTGGATTSTKAGASGKGKAAPKPVSDDDDEDEDEDDDTPVPAVKKGAVKGKAADADEDEDDEDDDEDADDSEDSDDDSDDDDDEADPATAAATELILNILADPAEFVRNFDEDAANGGITVKQAYTASFAAYKGDKKLKGPVANLVNDADFHKANAKAGKYQFDAKKGVLTLNPTKGKKK